MYGGLKVPAGAGRVGVDKDHPINKLNVRPDLWTATDGLGRTLPTYKDVGDKKDKYVGMFYWTWHKATPTTLVPRDITKIMKQYPEAQNDYNHKVWYEVENPIYYWEEPIYGYYLATDKYVLKACGTSCGSGVDVVFFDAQTVRICGLNSMRHFARPG